MNIHEYQAKQLLKKFRIPVPNGIFGFSVDELLDKIKSLNAEKSVSELLSVAKLMEFLFQ